MLRREKKGDKEAVKDGVVEIKKSINYYREDNDKRKNSQRNNHHLYPA